jgi:hypothetical protein
MRPIYKNSMVLLMFFLFFMLQFDHIDLLILLIREIYIRKVANSEGALVGIPSKVISLDINHAEEGSKEEGDEGGADEAATSTDTGMDLYESLCLVVLSRTLQRRILRPCAGRILHQLPRIPVECVRLLELLLLTGTKPVLASGSAPPTRRGGLHGGAVDRGTRLAALEILGSLLFNQSCMNDSTTFFHVLCPLLWLCVDEDFSTRTGAVNCLVGACRRIERDHFPGEGLYHVRSAILLFAMQAALHCTGTVGNFSQLVRQRGGDQEGQQQQSRRNSSVRSASGTPSEDLLGFVTSSTWIDGDDKEHESLEAAQQEMEVKMEVDGQGQEEEEAAAASSFLDIDQVFASECFDQGAMFGGEFLPLASGVDGNVQQEAFMKRHFHLMSQLCMNKHTLLTLFFNIYEVTLAKSSSSEEEEEEKEKKEGGEGEKVDENVHFQYLRRQVEKEVLSIIPLLLPATRSGFSRHRQSTTTAATPVEIITHLMEHCNITSTLPLFCLVLEKVLDPISMPAGEELIQLGRDLYARLPPNPINICVLIPLLGGMTTSEVEDLLPQVIRELSSPAFVPLATTLTGGADVSPDEQKEKQRLLKNTFLRKAFYRITHTRPPPLSRAKLLVSLHRIDMEKHSLKLKNVLDAIGLCIAEKEEYSAEVMKEAILTLLQDEIPAVALMRTVLLSAQTMPEMQKFTLHEVIPRLVRKKTWLIAPKAWEGVLMCVKTFSGQRDFEPTIRAFVGLPMTQLKSVITIAKDVKGILNRILRSMSSADIEECVSGRWAGLEDLNIAQTAKEKEDKDIFIKSILQK